MKILCKDSSGENVSIKVAIKRINEKEIISCARYSEKLELINTQEVALDFVCKDGIYKTKTLLKSVEKDEPYVVFILKTPENIEYEQLREFFRIPVKYDCTCITEDGNSISGITTNISANGVCVEFHKTFIFSKNLKLRISIEKTNIELVAKYIRSDFAENNYKVSFAFTKISEQDRDYISQVCIKKQLEHKRNSLL
jgi:c-di-GMP-binding flagellar brake protein YcgR